MEHTSVCHKKKNPSHKREDLEEEEKIKKKREDIK